MRAARIVDAGHHAVDDATILEPGTCELEGWLTHAGPGEGLAHAGLGCRVGPVELGAATDHGRDPAGNATGYGLQVKWATEVAHGVSAGFSLTPGWQAHLRPRYQGSTLAALLTWAAGESLAFHANLGRDLLRGASDQNRSGVAAEWMPAAGWSLVAERYAESATQFLRAGARWGRSPNTSPWT